MAFSFQEALNQPVDSIERPPLPPLGHYEWVVSKVPTMTERGQYDIIEFPMQAVAPQEDVDTDELKAFGQVKKIVVRHSFLFDREDDVAAQTTLSRLRTFLEKHLLVKFEGVPLKQALNDSVNKHFLGQLRYRADKTDPSTQYPEMGRTAPLE